MRPPPQLTALPVSLIACLPVLLLPDFSAYALNDPTVSDTSATSPAIKTLEDGLIINTTHAVLCSRKTRTGDTIFVHYRGTLASNGQQFDSSYDRGEPFQFTLGLEQVIRGWDEGLLDMCVGDQRSLTVPPTLGYGDRGAGTVIPGGATLRT